MNKSNGQADIGGVVGIIVIGIVAIALISLVLYMYFCGFKPECLSSAIEGLLSLFF